MICSVREHFTKGFYIDISFNISPIQMWHRSKRIQIKYSVWILTYHYYFIIYNSQYTD